MRGVASVEAAIGLAFCLVPLFLLTFDVLRATKASFAVSQAVRELARNIETADGQLDIPIDTLLNWFYQGDAAYPGLQSLYGALPRYSSRSAMEGGSSIDGLTPTEWASRACADSMGLLASAVDASTGFTCNRILNRERVRRYLKSAFPYLQVNSVDVIYGGAGCQTMDPSVSGASPCATISFNLVFNGIILSVPIIRNYQTVNMGGAL